MKAMRKLSNGTDENSKEFQKAIESKDDENIFDVLNSMFGDIGDKEEILKLLNNYYKLSDVSISRLFDASVSIVDDANDIHQFTSKINDSLDDDEKLIIIEMLWKIIIADGRIDDYENALIRKLSGLLYIDDFKVGEIKKRLTG